MGGQCHCGGCLGVSRDRGGVQCGDVQIGRCVRGEVWGYHLPYGQGERVGVRSVG